MLAIRQLCSGPWGADFTDNFFLPIFSYLKRYRLVNLTKRIYSKQPKFGVRGRLVILDSLHPGSKELVYDFTGCFATPKKSLNWIRLKADVGKISMENSIKRKS